MSYQFGKRLSIAGRMFRGVAAILTVTGPLGFAVLHAMQAHSPLLHPTTTPPPSFEVATIKPSEEEKPGLRIQMDHANFVVERASLKDLIKYAYSMRSDDQIVGKQSWMSSQFFNIHAKAADREIETIKKLSFPQDIEQTQLMVQSLLVDRFELKVSSKPRIFPSMDS
jgi:hypothetical protein